MKGIFGDMFDFDGNGDLDIFEQAAELCFLEELEKEDAEERDFEDLDEFDDDDF